MGVCCIVFDIDKKTFIMSAHPHDMVHIPAKFRENTEIRVSVRRFNISYPAGDKKGSRQLS